LNVNTRSRRAQLGAAEGKEDKEVPRHVCRHNGRRKTSASHLGNFKGQEASGKTPSRDGGELQVVSGKEVAQFWRGGGGVGGAGLLLGITRRKSSALEKQTKSCEPPHTEKRGTFTA